MTLNASGPISLAGSTSGQSIALELALSATGTISLNQANVRSLAGVSSGAITMPTNFWGKSGPPTTIGQAYGGGYYVGGYSTSGNNVQTHYLICAPYSTGETNQAFYGIGRATSAMLATSSTSTAIYDGYTTTYAIPNDSRYPGVQFVRGLTIGGYTDWYVPSPAELSTAYYNLKPTTSANGFPAPLFGISNGPNGNPWQIPQLTTNYVNGSTTNPGKTSVTIFQDYNSESFYQNQTFWSPCSNSFGLSTVNLYYTSFFNGICGNLADGTVNRGIRAFRKVPI